MAESSWHFETMEIHIYCILPQRHQQKNAVLYCAIYTRIIHVSRDLHCVKVYFFFGTAIICIFTYYFQRHTFSIGETSPKLLRSLVVNARVRLANTADIIIYCYVRYFFEFATSLNIRFKPFGEKVLKYYYVVVRTVYRNDKQKKKKNIAKDTQ